MKTIAVVVVDKVELLQSWVECVSLLQHVYIKNLRISTHLHVIRKHVFNCLTQHSAQWLCGRTIPGPKKNIFFPSRSSPFPSTSDTRRLQENLIPPYPHSHSLPPFCSSVPLSFWPWTMMISRSCRYVTPVRPWNTVLSLVSYWPFSLHIFDVFHTVGSKTVAMFGSFGVVAM